jgi:hypothetical protein
MQTHKDSRNHARDAMLEASELPQPSVIDIDPEDPSQVLDDVRGVDLDVSAQPHAEADADLDAAVANSSSDEEASELDTPEDTTFDAYAEDADDTGDLYGVHQPRAADPNMDTTPDREEFTAADQGEHWLETLGKEATEGGPAPEHEVDVIDDSDEHIDHRGHNPTESGDRPVADKGSGGDGGL